MQAAKPVQSSVDWARQSDNSMVPAGTTSMRLRSVLTPCLLQVEGGWLLNGAKRWIGNATFAEVVVVWARNLTTRQINAFVVRKGTKGFHTAKIENKIALRIVQNADIRMTDVFVPDSARLTGVNSFKVCCCPMHI